MLFSFDLTVPANTAEADALKLAITLPPGTIDQVEVVIPSGCVGLARTWATRGASQIWPTNPDAMFSGNGNPLLWAEDYDLDDAPFGFTLHAFNLDDTFPHTLTWRFSLRRLPSDRAAQLAARLQESGAETIEVEL